MHRQGYPVSVVDREGYGPEERPSDSGLEGHGAGHQQGPPQPALSQSWLWGRVLSGSVRFSSVMSSQFFQFFITSCFISILCSSLVFPTFFMACACVPLVMGSCEAVFPHPHMPDRLVSS